jgi:hypothetical protein
MSNVPTWVYVLFLGVLYIGIKRCYTRVMSVNRLALLPLIFGYFSFRSVNTLFGMDILSITILLCGIIIGIILGYLQVKNRIIQADKVNQLIKIPGDYSMLILVLAIFFVEFFIHYAVDDHWMVSDSMFFKILAVVISGVVMGISTGRNTSYYYKYFKSDSLFSLTDN